MKKLTLIAAVALMASTAFAGVDVRVGDEVKVPNGGYDLSLLGGPITLQNLSAGGSFTTFCVEMGELIYVPNVRYTVDGIGDTTVASGYTMSERTAWLYSNFRSGSLAGYTNASAENDALQYAIWRSMGYSHSEITSRHNNAVVNAAQTLADVNGWWKDSVANFNDVPNWSGLGNVRVANLVRNSNGQLGQDQLVIVPVPAAALLGVLGLGLVARAKRHLS